MNVVAIRFPCVLNSFHWPSLRLARAWLSGNIFVFPLLVTVAVDSSCFMASVIVGLSANMTFSRSILLDSGASSRLLFGWCRIVDVNPTLCIRGHVSPEVPLSSGGVVLNSIFHLGRVPPGIELSFPI